MKEKLKGTRCNVYVEYTCDYCSFHNYVAYVTANHEKYCEHNPLPSWQWSMSADKLFNSETYGGWNVKDCLLVEAIQSAPEWSRIFIKDHGGKQYKWVENLDIQVTLERGKVLVVVTKTK